MFSILPTRFAVSAFIAALIALALALPAAASAAAELTLTVNLAGEGDVEVECEVEGGAEPCESAYPEGAKLTLVPIAEAGSTFAGFSAGTGSATGCTGTSPCTFTITADSSVTATFEPPPERTLTINYPGTGYGEIECRVAGEGEFYFCAEEYPDKTKLTLRPELELEEGSKFTGWSLGTGSAAGCTGTSSCTFRIEEDSEIDATFDLKQFALSVTKKGNGNGTWECEVEEGPKPCAEKYAYGTELILIAEANLNSEFVEWGGECDFVAGNECEVEMEGPRSVTATFNSTAEYTLAVEGIGTGSGTVTGSPGSISCGSVCSDEFLGGTKVTLTATAAEGSVFSGWKGGGCLSAGTGACTVTIKEAATTVKAIFDANPSPTPTPTPEPEKAGTAKAAATASVGGGKAALKLSCSGGPCKGTLKLTAKVKQGERTRNKVIGKAPFSLAAGTSKTIKAKITNSQVKKLLKRGKTVKSKLSGAGIQPRTVKLKPPKNPSR